MKLVLILIIYSIFFTANLEAKSLQVMSYNVENLFDAKHDVENGKDKKDWAFLPKDSPLKKEACNKEKSRHRRKECLDTDWNNTKVELKISQIHDVVLKENALPDFLALVEVENSNVVGQLAKKLGYTNFEITDSPDERGVDVALLYKTTKEIKKISRTEHVVAVDYPTRNILEVEFLIDNIYPLTIFVNHWPSLANPDSWRVKAAEVLATRTKEIMAKNPSMSIMAMGDFNTIDDNDPHPFKTVLYKDNLFQDVTNKQKVPGTYYYAPKDQWNSLDHFFTNKVLADGKDLEISIKSFEIYSPTFITEEIKKKIHLGEELSIKLVTAPKRFNPEAITKETIGYSDHFPIMVKLEYPDVVIKKTANKKKK